MGKNKTKQGRYIYIHCLSSRFPTDHYQTYEKLALRSFSSIHYSRQSKNGVVLILHTIDMYLNNSFFVFFVVSVYLLMS